MRDAAEAGREIKHDCKGLGKIYDSHFDLWEFRSPGSQDPARLSASAFGAAVRLSAVAAGRPRYMRAERTLSGSHGLAKATRRRYGGAGASRETLASQTRPRQADDLGQREDVAPAARAKKRPAKRACRVGSSNMTTRAAMRDARRKILSGVGRSVHVSGDREGDSGGGGENRDDGGERVHSASLCLWLFPAALRFGVFDRRRDEITHPVSQRRKREKLLRCTLGKALRPAALAPRRLQNQ